MSLALDWKASSARPGGIGAARGPQARPREEPVRRVEKRLGETGEAGRARKKVERSRKMRLAFTCLIGLAVAFSGLLIVSICLQVSVAQNEIKARETEHLIDLERRRQEELRVEIAALESPDRIESIAVEDLGMVHSNLAEYVETPAYRLAKINVHDEPWDKEAMVSDAAAREP